MDTDPHTQVAAPVRRALAKVVLRGLVLVGVVGTLALLIVAARPDAAGRDTMTAIAIGVLAGYAVMVRGLRIARGRPTHEERAVAWDRALEIDGGDTMLALVVAAWVPAALFLALAVLLWPHLTDADPMTASSWAVFGVAAAGLAWLAMVDAWLEAARDDLARAEHEADLRFRGYWANLGGDR